MQIEIPEPVRTGSGNPQPGGERKRDHSQKRERNRKGLELEGFLSGWEEFCLKENLPFGKIDFSGDMERILTMDSEEKTLLDYAGSLGLTPKKDIESRRNQRFKPLAGNEHKVFHDREFPGRVLKFTHPGKFGRKEHTPFLYLDRWRLQEILVPATKPKLEAIFQDEKSQLCMVVSMPWIKGPHPTPQELDQYVKERGFTPIRDGSTTLDYVCPHSGLIYRDCHPDNWVKVSRKGEPLTLFPIDICLERIPPCSKES